MHPIYVASNKDGDTVNWCMVYMLEDRQLVCRDVNHTFCLVFI